MSTPPVTDPMGHPLTHPCPVCTNQIALDAPFCPHCGTVLRRRGPNAPVIVAAVLAVAVGVLLALLITQGDDNPKTPSAPAGLLTGPSGPTGVTAALTGPTAPAGITTSTATPLTTSTAPRAATGPSGASGPSAGSALTGPSGTTRSTSSSPSG